MTELSQQFLASARQILGDKNMICDQEAATPYLHEWRDRWHGFTPLIVLPDSTRQVTEIVQLCAQHQVAVTPQGGNTGLVGGQIPQGEILLSTKNLQQIPRINKSDMTLTVSAGVSLSDAAGAAFEHDLLFPMELASGGSATIGGAISTNAGGMMVLRYGTMRELVLGLEVVLADGQVWTGMNSLYKNNTGYDLKQMFIGAEGTLGIVTKAVLRLFPMPKAKTLAWCSVNSVADATRALGYLQNHCADPVAKFELVSQLALSLVLQNIPGAKKPLAHDAPWSVMVEFESWHGSEIAQNALASALDKGLIIDAVIARSQKQHDELLALRENISAAQKSEGAAIKHDISLPLANIADFLKQARNKILQQIPDTRLCVFGHLGDGNLHYNLLSPIGMKSDDFTRRRSEITTLVHDLVQEMGGSFSAEHGIGIARINDLKRYKTEVEIAMMRQIKQALDPDNLMNPRLWFS